MAILSAFGSRSSRSSLTSSSLNMYSRWQGVHWNVNSSMQPSLLHFLTWLFHVRGLRHCGHLVRLLSMIMLRRTCGWFPGEAESQTRPHLAQTSDYTGHSAIGEIPLGPAVRIGKVGNPIQLTILAVKHSNK